MLTRAFAGRVSDYNGKVKLIVLDRPGFLRHLETLNDQPVEIIVRERQIQRSDAQNRFWHAVPFKLLSEHLGYTVEEIKLLCLGECWGWHDVLGGRLPNKLHTSKLTKEEGAHFTEWLQTWAMTEFGVVVPSPNEVDWEAA